ncbi:MAG: NAD-dependent epimerase/dehydratase family protein [Nitrososphaeria archaeon]|jgi:UDP-glucose 4-epimerase
MKKALVTGGAGFIGSHIVDALMSDGLRVTICDNLSSGKLDNIQRNLGKDSCTFFKGDMLEGSAVSYVLKGCDVVWHLAANPEVKLSSTNPDIHYKQNILATYNLLEAIRKDGNVKILCFASTSTVYGDALQIPTLEDCSPLEPVSVYGASKLACEALISAYAHTYGFNAIIYRLANVVGPRSEHGVIYDFVRKLQGNPKELEILGDGAQTKSYLHVRDCVEAMQYGLDNSKKQVEVFNVGSEDQINVKAIAEIVIEEMGLKGVELKFTGGVDGGRGWIGDVKNMLLDVGKLKALGWKPELNSENAVRSAAKDLIKKMAVERKSP